MAYLGNTPTTQSFISGTDYFNGDGSTTAFTLTRTVNSVNDIEAVVNNVVQQPNTAYTISGTTITFTSAPSSGSSNIYVRYLSTTTQSITPSQNTVSYSTLNSDTQSKLGISFKNRMINGNMAVAQRGTTALAVDNGAWYFPVDRFCAYQSVASSKFTVQQNAGSVTPPTGFNYYFGATVTSAYTPTGTDWLVCRQTIEGYNVADLGWGTANAKTVTVSFWVRSSLTGNLGAAAYNLDGSRSYPFIYTINTANTWEFKTITIPGCTDGTWNSTSNAGLTINWAMGAGSTYTGPANAWASTYYVMPTGGTNIVSTNGATFYLTGVQLEVGTQATTFDYRSYGTELALCQRYFQKTNPGLATGNGGLNGTYFATTNGGVGYQFPVTLRATPTVTRSSSNNTFYVSNIDGASPGTTSGAVISTTGYWTQLSSMTSAAIGYPIFYNGSLSIEAEL